MADFDIGDVEPSGSPTKVISFKSMPCFKRNSISVLITG